EAPALGVDHDRKRVAGAVRIVRALDHAELRRVPPPRHGVPAGPVAVRTRADLQCHPEPLAEVVARAAHLSELPAGAEIARAPFRVSLEAAAGEHHRAR